MCIWIVEKLFQFHLTDQCNTMHKQYKDPLIRTLLRTSHTENSTTFHWRALALPCSSASLCLESSTASTFTKGLNNFFNLEKAFQNLKTLPVRKSRRKSPEHGATPWGKSSMRPSEAMEVLTLSSGRFGWRCQRASTSRLETTSSLFGNRFNQ